MAGESDKELLFNLVFNTETGQLSVATDQLEQVSAAAQDVGAAAQEGSDEAMAAVEDLGAATQAEIDKVYEEAVAFEELAAAQQESGEAGAEAGQKGADGLGKIESRITRVALNIALMQLALSGFMAVAKDNTAFQELQQVFENTFSELFNDFGPALTLIANGLAGIVQWVGALGAVLAPVITLVKDTVSALMDWILAQVNAWIEIFQGNFRAGYADLKSGLADAKAEFSGLGDEFSKGLTTAKDRFFEGVDTMTGKAKVFTKAMATEHEAQLNAEVAHQAALTKLRVDALNDEMAKEGTTAARKLAIIQQEEALEIKSVKDQESVKEQVIADKVATQQIKASVAAAQITTLHQSTADKIIAIEAKAAHDEEAIRNASQKALVANLDQQSVAMADAASKAALAGGNGAQIIAAAGAAEVSELGKQASTKIALYGATAAGAAYAKAVEGMPVGPAAFAVGAAAALPILGWYTALAAGVSIAAGGLSNAMTGGGSGGSSSSSSSSSSTAAPTTSTVAAAASAPVGAVAPAGGGGTLVVQVLLDSQVLLKFISKASFEGNLQIDANAITPS